MLGMPALYVVLFVLQCSVDALKTLGQDSYTYTGVFTMKFNQHKVEAREKHKPETVSETGKHQSVQNSFWDWRSSIG